MALGSTQPDTNEYQEYFLGSKGGRCLGLTTLPPSCADCLEIWEPQPLGIFRACPGLYRDCLYEVSFVIPLGVLYEVCFKKQLTFVEVLAIFRRGIKISTFISPSVLPSLCAHETRSRTTM